MSGKRRGKVHNIDIQHMLNRNYFHLFFKLIFEENSLSKNG